MSGSILPFDKLRANEAKPVSPRVVSQSNHDKFTL